MDHAEIRIAGIADAAAISELANQLGYPTSMGQAESRLDTILSSSDHTVFVACVDRQVVGWVHVFLAKRIESGPFAELGGFVVAESHRRRGHGRRLLAAAEEWAAGRGVTMLRVRSRSERDDARAFYENFGFTIIKEQRVFDRFLK
jgi:GNAT superfamily N-acetyltransferase